MKYLKFLFLCFLFASCATIDVENKLNENGFTSQIMEAAPADVTSIIVQPDVVYIDRPMYVPEQETPPRPPAAGQSTVRESNRDGILLPQDYSHAAIVYDYDSDFVYEIYTQPLRITDVMLEPNEIAIEAPFISDSERWLLGGGVNVENGASVQHIYIKPVSSGLSASLIINTNRRVYRIILRSYSDIYMPLVKWRYVSSMPQNFINSFSDSAAAGASNGLPNLDPRFLSFNYRITHSIFSKPYWLPDLVFDDGSKTYIRFPPLVLQRELPAVFENRRNVVNYRVMGNIIIIDKLIETITVKIENVEITINKKRG